MKDYPLSILSKECWREIDFFFRLCEIPCIDKGSSGDGFIAENIETNKRGVEITGVMTFLGGKTGYFENRMVLCLSKPQFSSVQSITPEKIANAILAEAYIEGKLLYITIS